MDDKYKIAIIGPEEVVSGFKALGVTLFNVANGEEALSILKKIKKDIDDNEPEAEKFAVALIIEDIMEDIPKEEMEKVSGGALPAVLALPGLKGSKGAGVAKLKRLAEKAVGSDILG